MNAVLKSVLSPLCAMKKWPGSVAIGALLGAALIPVAGEGVGAAVRAYYHARPIVTMRATLVVATSAAITVHLEAHRRASECRYVRMLAYTIDAEGQLQDASIKRLGLPESGTTKPPGVHDIGLWVIEPRADGVRVRIDIVHECAARIITGTVVVMPIA
jgi:hypothetical protein